MPPDYARSLFPGKLFRARKGLRTGTLLETNLAMNINLSVSTSTPVKQIDLNSLPVTQVDKGSRGVGALLMIFACFWGGIPTFALIKALSSGTMRDDMWGFLVFSILGSCMFLGGLYMLTCSTTTTLSRDQASVIRKSIFGTKHWIARLSEYTGVRWRSEYHSGGKNRPSYTLYIVELLHPESRKTVRLYESRMDVGIRGIWENACRALNMPAVEGEGAGIVIRSVEDLDKSVKELAREGKLKVDFDPTKPPPAGLTLKVDGKFLELSVKTRVGSTLGGGLFGILFAGIFVYVGFFIKSGPILFGIIGSIIMLVVILAMIWALITTEQIRVAKDEIHVRRKTPWGPTNGTRISTTGVETVRIGKRNGQGSEGILVETDGGTEIIGTGLPAPCLEWLRNCILKVITA